MKRTSVTTMLTLKNQTNVNNTKKCPHGTQPKLMHTDFPGSHILYSIMHLFNTDRSNPIFLIGYSICKAKFTRNTQQLPKLPQTHKTFRNIFLPCKKAYYCFSKYMKEKKNTSSYTVQQITLVINSTDKHV